MDRIDICFGLSQFLLYWNFIPLQNKHKLSLEIEKAYLITLPTITSEKEIKKDSSFFDFKFTWFSQPVKDPEPQVKRTINFEQVLKRETYDHCETDTFELTR